MDETHGHNLCQCLGSLTAKQSLKSNLSHSVISALKFSTRRTPSACIPLPVSAAPGRPLSAMRFIGWRDVNIRPRRSGPGHFWTRPSFSIVKIFKSHFSPSLYQLDKAMIFLLFLRALPHITVTEHHWHRPSFPTLKYTKCVSGRGSAPDPASPRGAYSTP